MSLASSLRLGARPLRPAAWQVYLLASAGVIAVHYTLGQGSGAQALVYQLVNFGPPAAFVAGMLLHRPERRLHWWLLAAATFLWWLGDDIWTAYDFVFHVERPYPSIADLIYLAGYAFLLGAMVSLLRSRSRPKLADVLDMLIVALGVGLLLWFALIRPVAIDATATIAGRATSVAYPVLDALVLVGLTQLLLTTGNRGVSFRLFAAGGAVLLGTDVVYGLESLDGTYVSGGLLDGGWLLVSALWGAAALHPSMRLLHRFAPVRKTRLTWQRLAVLALASLVPDVVVALDAHDAAFSELITIVVAATLLTMLVFTRMGLLFRDHARAVAELRDAHAREQVAATMRDSNDRFHAASRAIDCALYEWVVERDVIVFSEGLAESFGWHLEDGSAPQEWWLERIHPDDRQEVVEIDERALAGSGEQDSHYRFLGADGRWHHVWDRWEAQTDAAGHMVGSVGGMVDVTEYVELEARLGQAQKMEAIGRLAGGIAHDFNNLIMAIDGYAGLATTEAAPLPRVVSHLGEIRRAAGRAASLTQQLLAFGRKQVLQPTVIDLARVVRELEPMLRRLVREDVQIELDLAEGCTVLADQTQLEQVVVNLAVNARDAMPTGGVLRIGVQPRSEGQSHVVALSVADTGVGMDEQTQQRIFEPFFTTKGLGHGTGLGLATVDGIVEQSGGRIVLDSRDGEGTRFDVLLPFEDREPEPDGPAAQAPAVAAASARILLVEDERIVRAVLSTMLTQIGYDVVEAAHPDEALAIVGEGARFDAVVSDLVMPSMNGRELVERLTELTPLRGVVFVSGYPEEDEAPRAPAGTASAFLSKPFTEADLVTALNGVLGELATV
jgi:signal transduction histidine kinase/ActR/RegA family two-component response regulator